MANREAWRSQIAATLFAEKTAYRISPRRTQGSFFYFGVSVNAARGETWPDRPARAWPPHRLPLTLVTFILGDLLRDMLHLQEQFDALDGRHGRLGDSRGHATGEEILHEAYGIGERHFERVALAGETRERCVRIAHSTANGTSGRWSRRKYRSSRRTQSRDFPGSRLGASGRNRRLLRHDLARPQTSIGVELPADSPRDSIWILLQLEFSLKTLGNRLTQREIHYLSLSVNLTFAFFDFCSIVVLICILF